MTGWQGRLLPCAMPATGRENKNMAMDLRDPNVWITPRNWHRLLMIFLPCTSVRLIVRHRLLSPLRRPPVVHHRPPPRLKAA
ncbi:hypothetical protein HMPREF9543_02075 [Escherichia coli MS 146-1]|nr:hypothetical protein HMPREF9543_02075 [Escherichia coli MS 146-1]